VAAGTAYFGRRCLSVEEVTRIYGGLHVSGPELVRRRAAAHHRCSPYFNSRLHRHRQRAHFRQIIDPFSLVTAALTADIVDAFSQRGVSFHPSYVYADVCAAVAHLGKGAFAAEVAAAPGAFISDAPRLYAMLRSLHDAGRKTMLLTNSDFRFVDVGMRHMLRGQLEHPEEWPSLFDVVVVSAQRPAWFTLDAPLRSLNTNTRACCCCTARLHACPACCVLTAARLLGCCADKVRWLPVRELRPGAVYAGGSFAELNRLVPGGLNGQDVLYMTSLSNPGRFAGADPFDDLSVPSAIGWRTGAVIAEVEREVRAQSHPRYREALEKLLSVERRVRRAQLADADQARATPANHVNGAGATSRAAQEPLLELRDELKQMLNPRFGSCFRTLTGPTLFAHNLLRFSDLYTARLENLCSLGPDSFLFPLRRALPHEPWGGSV
jgi:hypothetical protein